MRYQGQVTNAFKPGLKIGPSCIHVADDVPDISHNSRENKDSKEKHAPCKDVFLPLDKKNELGFNFCCQVDKSRQNQPLINNMGIVE